jgi:hypothetical protein
MHHAQNRALAVGVTARLDRGHRFRITRALDSHGFHVYTLANEARGEQVRISRYLFDRFRAIVRQALRTYRADKAGEDFVSEVYFKTVPHFRLAANKSEPGGLVIREMAARAAASSFVTLTWLDEHYRCPPEIIEYSNQYVYGHKLKIMQWRKAGAPPAVVVDHSEAKAEASTREQSGKFRGVETGMVDRFFDYVASTVRAIERETGTPINLETDVAICYFLLKNEPYVRSIKGDFLRRLRRGSDVLDGAGAALQGKERDYIFYLWDITRANIAAFRLGDDPSKRKGELNVLMSRPRRRAYHYLHKDFATLAHNTTSIADYLWMKYQRQPEGKQRTAGAEPIASTEAPKGRGAALSGVLEQTLACDPATAPLAALLRSAQPGIVVGDASHVVDLVLTAADPQARATSLALVDLSQFSTSTSPGLEVRDYYFQLQRVQPRLRALCVFLPELADINGPAYRSVVRALESLCGAGCTSAKPTSASSAPPSSPSAPTPAVTPTPTPSSSPPG